MKSVLGIPASFVKKRFCDRTAEDYWLVKPCAEMGIKPADDRSVWKKDTGHAGVAIQTRSPTGELSERDGSF